MGVVQVPDSVPQYADQLRRIAALDERFRLLLARSLDLNFSALEAMEWLMRDGPLTPSELAERLSLTPGAVTGVIKRLEGTGHAHREASDRDGRSVRIAAEPESVRLATERLLPLIRDISGRADRYSEAEMAVVHRFLDDVTQAYRAGIDSLEPPR